MIWAFLQRRWWLTENRILTTISTALMLPVILYISIVAVMENIIPRSIDGVVYTQWVFPGLIMIIATLGLVPLLYRDFFDLRIHRHVLQPVTLTPITKFEIIAGIIITAIIESVCFVLISLFVLLILIPMSVPVYSYFILIFYVILFNGVMANVLITISLLAERVTTYLIILLSFLMFILFSSGILVDFEFYPPLLSQVFANLPTSVLMAGIRQIMFFNRFDYLSLIYPMIVIVVWFAVNGILYKTKAHQ